MLFIEPQAILYQNIYFKPLFIIQKQLLNNYVLSEM